MPAWICSCGRRVSSGQCDHYRLRRNIRPDSYLMWRKPVLNIAIACHSPHTDSSSMTLTQLGPEKDYESSHMRSRLSR
jgi:hypothetical protein